MLLVRDDLPSIYRIDSVLSQSLAIFCTIVWSGGGDKFRLSYFGYRLASGFPVLALASAALGERKTPVLARCRNGDVTFWPPGAPGPVPMILPAESAIATAALKTLGLGISGWTWHIFPGYDLSRFTPVYFGATCEIFNVYVGFVKSD